MGYQVIRGTVNGSSPLTRPANTTAYTAAQVVADSTSAGHVWTFSRASGFAGGRTTIVMGVLMTSQTTCTEAFRLHLYQTAPTALNDAGACTAPLIADVTKYVGTYNFPACKTEGAGATAAYAINNYDRIPILTTTADAASLYGILETPNGFTPASGQTFEIVLTVDQD